MCVQPSQSAHPDWDRLFEVAAAQNGLFTTQQAAEAGYSPQLLVHHLQSGNVLRMMRGIYRLKYYPVSEHEELVSAWLWSERAGVISHDTALALYDISDVLPARLHLTVPSDWKRRRLRVPPMITLHYADLTERDRNWFDAVPITTVVRTLNDCALDSLAPDLLRQATQQALRQGRVERTELGLVERALAPFGGIDP